MNSRSDDDPFRDVDERLADWVDGRLPARDRERFEAEMRVSPRLRDEAEAYRRSVQAVQTALRAPGPRVDLADRVLARLRERPVPASPTRVRAPWRPLPILASLAAAAVIVISIVTLDAWSPGVPLARDVARAPELSDALPSAGRDRRADGVLVDGDVPPQATVGFTSAPIAPLPPDGLAPGAVAVDDHVVAMLRVQSEALETAPRAPAVRSIEDPTSPPRLEGEAHVTTETKSEERAKANDPYRVASPGAATAGGTDRSGAGVPGVGFKGRPPGDAQAERDKADAGSGALREGGIPPTDVAEVAKSLEDDGKKSAGDLSLGGAPPGRPEPRTSPRVADAPDDVGSNPAESGRQRDAEADGAPAQDRGLRSDQSTGQSAVRLSAPETQVPVLVVTSRSGQVAGWMATTDEIPDTDLRAWLANRSDAATEPRTADSQQVEGLQRHMLRFLAPSLDVGEQARTLGADAGNADLVASMLTAGLLPAETTAARGWLVEGSDDDVAGLLRQVGRFAKAEGLELNTAEFAEREFVALAQPPASPAARGAVSRGGARPTGSAGPPAGAPAPVGGVAPGGRPVSEPRPAPTVPHAKAQPAAVPRRRVVLLFRDLPPLLPVREPTTSTPATGGDGKK